MKAQLLDKSKQGIDARVFYTKNQTINRQLELFEKLLVNKIADFYKKAPIDEITEIIRLYFTKNVRTEVSKLIAQIHRDENLFYESRLKTADVIFETVGDNRTKTIYLDNVLKKIGERECDLTQSALSYMVNKDVTKEDIFGIDPIFGHCFSELVDQLQLSVDDADDIHQLAVRYCNKLKFDMSNAIKKMVDANKAVISKDIESEMDRQQVRNGKTTEVYKMERELTNSTVIDMENYLKLIIERNKAKSRVVLAKCSSVLATSILELLPEEYKDQKELVEVIIDTNTERLNSIFDEEINKLMSNLSQRNKDQIQNEFYEEKRYKDIPIYICDFDAVDKVYPSILREVMIAYDIPINEIKPENNPKSQEINHRITSQGNITKGAFRMLADNIVNENVRSLESLKVRMHEDRISNNQKLMNNSSQPGEISTQSVGPRK